MALLGPKSMDQEQWVEAVIKDILKPVKKKKSPQSQPPQRSASYHIKKVRYLLLELFKNKH